MRRLLWVTLALMLLLCACAGEEQTVWHIYYPVAADNGTDNALGTEVWQNAPERVDAALLVMRMLQPPASEGFLSPYPEGVELRSWALEGGLLTLNFSEDYGALTGVSLTLANSCAVLTCAQLPDVERVSLRVEGRLLPEGRSGPFSAGDFLSSGGEGGENPASHIDGE